MPFSFSAGFGYLVVDDNDEVISAPAPKITVNPRVDNKPVWDFGTDGDIGTKMQPEVEYKFKP